MSFQQVQLQDDEQLEKEGAESTAMDLDPLTGLTESQRLALLIRFGAAGTRGGMCAAMSHGHSFQSSIFRLPAKCAGCHELVWGPFTRGCTCLTCAVTVHRSCTGMVTMPKCPTKDAFETFCRAELGLLPPPARTGDARPDGPAPSSATATGGSSEDDAAKAPGGVTSAENDGSFVDDTSAGGDLEEWAKVDGASEHSVTGAVKQSPSPHQQHQQHQPHQQQAPASASHAVQDLGSSFSWSSLGNGERKRPTSEDTGDDGRDLAIVGREAAADAPVSQETSGGRPATVATPDSAAASPTSYNHVGIRGVTKMSVAGGVVGALFGGPVGAVVGLKLGAVLGAGRSVQKGLWQRIEKNRREAGAIEIGLPQGEGAVTAVATAAAASAGAAQSEEADRKPRDLWARIAQKVEGEQPPVIWELGPEQKKLLEQGECDAGEVAMFVVGKVLADETAMLFHLHAALLAEFRFRHRLCECSRRHSRPIPIRRRSSDTDMVALFPRSGGRRGSSTVVVAENSGINRLEPSSGQNGGGFLTSTPGLEKTFSFVEEAEIVAGEGSDTPIFGEGGVEDVGGEDGEGSFDGSSTQGRRTGQGESSAASPGDWASGLRHASPSGNATAEAAAASAVASAAPVSDRRPSISRESWRNNSSRLGSWVQLEGGVCSSCGGRVVSGSSQSNRFMRTLASDVEEDEGELGEGWASAEAPLCWCRDEGGLMASPEKVQNSALANVPARRDAPAAAYAAAAAATDCSEERAVASMNMDGTACDALRDVHGLLRELTRAVLEWCPLLTASHEAQIQAVNCIDQRVFLETYGPVFCRIASSGTAREGDASLARRVRKEERSRAANGQPSLLSTCRPEAMSALRAAGAARTGRDKLRFLVRAVECVSDALAEGEPTTDALIFSVCRHLAAATWGAAVDDDDESVVLPGEEAMGGDDGGRGVDVQPVLPRPHAEVAFVEQFMRDESWVMGREGYVLTTIIAALQVLSDPELSDDIFVDEPPAS